MTISSQKISCLNKGVIIVMTLIAPCSDSPPRHQKNFLMRSSVAVAVTIVQVVVGRITVYSFYTCNSKNILNDFYL